MRLIFLLLLAPIVSAFVLHMSNKIVVRKATEEDFSKMKIKTWSTWGCGVSKFPWTYSDSETCYVIQGRVTVTPLKGDAVTIEAGDIATFPAGMSCVWDVSEAINKHYMFHD